MASTKRKPKLKLGYRKELYPGMRVVYTAPKDECDIRKGRILSVSAQSCLVWQDGMFDRSFVVGKQRILDAYIDCSFPSDLSELKDIEELNEDTSTLTEKLPNIGSKWFHLKDGTDVHVSMIANYPPSDGYITTVVFKDWRGRVKSRKLSSFLKDYAEASQYELRRR